MLTIKNNTRKKAPQVPFFEIAKHVLGEHYELSLVFTGDTLSRRLNRTYREKDRPTNVLSFPYDKKNGEIFLNLAQIRRESKKFAKPFVARTAFLFIHGLFHLKGMDHSSKMERHERETLAHFSITHD